LLENRNRVNDRPKEEAMSLIRLLIGRRQFLFTAVSSILTLAFGRVAKAFDLLFQTGTAKASEGPATGERKSIRGIVIYYSGTGNTAQVAEALWRGMRSVIPCDISPLAPAKVAKVKPEDMAKYDVIALGAPNWYMRVPANVLCFTHDMPRMDGKHVILFGTHGSGGPGMFWIMSKNILKKGMSIIGWSDWYGADFLTPHSSVPDGEWGHPDSIDLAEAEAFGRKMAENSIRIYAGERSLLPDEIPAPDVGGNSLFSPSGRSGTPSFAGGAANATPHFDFSQCVYPRCNRCIENCPAKAIDFSLVAPFGLLTHTTETVSPLVLKEACMQCGGLCERVCTYGAIAYIGDKGVRVFQDIDMKKCTYPKCTVCMDWCPMDAIDVTQNPPVVHNWCENEALCFGVCPENAISTTPTSMHIDEGAGGVRMGVGEEELEAMGEGRGPMAMPGGPGGMPGGPGEGPGMFGGMGGPQRIRNLVQSGGVNIGNVANINVYPRIPMYEKLWVSHMDDKEI